MNSFYTENELKKLKFISYGQNVFISRKVSIYGAENIEIGNNVRIDDFCLLSGMLKIGNYVHIGAQTMLFAGKYSIELSDFVTISSRCAIYAESDDYSGNGLSYPMLSDEYLKRYGGKVILKKHTLVGSGCTILPCVTINEGGIIGAMSLVNRDIPEWTVCVGIPCRIIKKSSKSLLKLERRLLAANNKQER
jgi:galactoside O-acetyltransferase